MKEDTLPREHLVRTFEAMLSTDPCRPRDKSVKKQKYHLLIRFEREHVEDTSFERGKAKILSEPSLCGRYRILRVFEGASAPPDSNLYTLSGTKLRKVHILPPVVRARIPRSVEVHLISCEFNKVELWVQLPEDLIRSDAFQPPLYLKKQPSSGIDRSVLSIEDVADALLTRVQEDPSVVLRVVGGEGDGKLFRSFEVVRTG